MRSNQVQVDWIDAFGIDKESVTLLRHNMTWKALPTLLLSTTEDALHYRAESSGLSWFAVTGTPEDEPGEAPGAEEPDTDVTKPAGEDTKPSSVTGDVCTSGERQCFGGIYIQVCNEQGTGWVNDASCYFGCRDGQCQNTYVLEIDYMTVWVSLIAIVILLVAAMIYMKRKAIDEFIFWRF